MLTRDANTWTPQIGEDYGTAVMTAFCGEPVAASAARPLATALAAPLRAELMR
jgi:hypothetical protein